METNTSKTFDEFARKFSQTGPVVLLTDFGLKDHYVGVMKGVIQAIKPGTTVVDLCHFVQPQSIAHGQLLLEDNHQYFGPGAVFCCVVDPGVGTRRNALVCLHNDQVFIGPDNGLLAHFALQEEAICKKLPTPEEASATFHGRDVFAPWAAKALVSSSLLDGHPDLASPLPFQSPLSTSTDNLLSPSIIFADHFGNLISNVKLNLEDIETASLNGEPLPIAPTYGHLIPDQVHGIIGSSSRFELAVKNGSAREKLDLTKPEDWLQLRIEIQLKSKN